MVSLTRLLAAADDSPPEEPAAIPLSTRLPRDCVFPSILSTDSIPPRLRRPETSRAVQSSHLASSSASSSASYLSSLRPPPLLPLQRLLRDLGPGATAPANMSALARTLAYFGRPSEPAVASALLFLATAVPPDSTTVDSHTLFQLFFLFCGDPENAAKDPTIQQAVASAQPSASEWRAHVLTKAVTTVAAQFNAPLDWRLVIRSLDVEGLETQLNQSAFVEIANAYIAGTNGTRIPADCILEDWQHKPAQLCMVSHALKTPEFIQWDTLDLFEGATPQDSESPYSRVALIEKLIEMDARDLLQVAVKKDAEIVLLSLTCSKPRKNASLKQRLTMTFLNPLIALFPASQKALRQMWNLAPSLVESGIIGIWKEDASMLRKALAIGIDMAILPDLLSSGSSIEFSLELAMLAYQQDVLKFESWLMELLRARGVQSISTLTVYLARKIRRGDALSAAQLSLDALRIVFRCLVTTVRALSGNQVQELMDAVQNVYHNYCKVNPRMKDLSPAADVGNPKILFGSEVAPLIPRAATTTQQVAPPRNIKDEAVIGSQAASAAAALLLPLASASDGSAPTFPAAVEKEADVYFGKLYKGDMPTDTAVDFLRRLKSSNAEHERQVFNCTVHTLFDEYRFFRKYPDRELRITGVLFGSLIQYSLLSGDLLGLAAKCVLDALRTIEPVPLQIGRLTKFGLVSLERFKSRLHEWPQYCAHILELERLKELAPELIRYVQKALDMNGAVIPSASEKKIGLAQSEKEDTNDPTMPPGGGTGLASSMRDGASDADAVRALVSSPPLSSTNTPVKGRSISSSSLRSPPRSGVDGSLGMSPVDLSSLLAMTDEEAGRVIAPDETIQDKIKFIFNNLSQSTMVDKVEEMLAILRAEYYAFLSIYIVVKRASVEANFHHLYLAMLDKMEPQAPSLLSMVFEMTYKRVRVLLAGDKSTASNDRTVLRSLGSWVGALTLQRNKPILRRDLDLKEALMNAYSKGRLTTVVPFAVKVLEHCVHSKVFKTTNPWVRGILSLVKEIYCVEDLKLNMKFELQILSKHLGIDVESIVPSDLLRSCLAPDRTHNPDFATKKSVSSSPPRVSPSPTTSPSPEMHRPLTSQAINTRGGAPVFNLTDSHSTPPALHVPGAAGPPASTGRLDIPPSLVPPNLSVMRSDPVGDISSILASSSLTSNAMNAGQGQRGGLHGNLGISSLHAGATSLRQTSNPSATETLIPNLAQYITVSPSLLLFQSNPSLKRMVPVAIDRAIREIIQPVVERSCAIALLTTKELTMKDFAHEPDMVKIRCAALQMVQQLAGSLALVTSKEPLRVSMGNQLRTILSPNVAADQNLVEQTAQIVCAANLEIGCAIIEKHAKEKAARDLNEKISQPFAARRIQQASYNFGMLPDPEVFKVYEEFARVSRGGSLSAPYNNNFSTHGQAAAVSQPLHLNQSLPHPVAISSSVADQPFNNAGHPTSVLATKGGGMKPSVYPGTRMSQPGQRPGEAGPIRAGGTSQGVVGSRRATTLSGPSDHFTASLLGSPLPELAAPSAVASVLMAVAGSSNGSGTGGAQNFLVPSNAGSVAGEEALSTQQVLERFNAFYPHLLSHIAEIVSSSSTEEVSLSDVPSEHEIHAVWVQIPASVKRSVTADEAGMAVAQKVFKGLYEGDSSLHREIHVLLLESLRESCRRLSKELSSWLAYSEDRKKLHRECIIALLKPGSLLNKTSYDEIAAKAIDNGRNLVALDFACFLVKRTVIEEPLATAAEFYLTLEAMAKVGRRPNPPDLNEAPKGLLALVEAARSVVHSTTASNPASGGNSEFHPASSNKHQRETDQQDPAGAKDFCASLLLKWHERLASDSSSHSVPDHVIPTYLEHLRVNVLANDESNERFFRLAIEIVCAVTSTALHSNSGNAMIAEDLVHFPYTMVESLVRLVSAICRKEAANSTDGTGKGISTICHFLVALVKDVLKSGPGSDLRPHFRLFCSLIGELTFKAVVKDQTAGDIPIGEPEAASTACADRLRRVTSKSEAISFLHDKNTGFLSCVRNAGVTGSNNRLLNLDNQQVLTAIVCALSACAPAIVPGFAFSWLQLISNKELLPSLLSLSNVHGWPLFRHLLVSMLKFLSAFLKDTEQPLQNGVKILYSGMLRVLLVLLHDFPEFLCAYHMSFCDAVPQNCIQLRNLVLASFPRDMRLPDPFLPELNVGELPDMLRQPLVLSNYTATLEVNGLKGILDRYVHSSSTMRRNSAPLQLESYLVDTSDTTGLPEYSIPRISALVLYVGQLAVSRTANGDASGVSGAPTDLLRSLTQELGPEGQHHLFNAIANQLRYPNNHTMYFSNLLLLLFQGATHDGVKEQITRVLVERLIANRPHPWGLLITFVHLIKNTEYNFWGHSFVRCAPEIEQLFENVAKFCVGPVLQNKHQSIVAAT